ncbi:MAG: holo-ACP synthase [Acidobacteria bacterium]|nr:holo-ACP synthase [Acidobacteriota bacterium]
MKVIKHGIDLVECKRLQEAIDRHGQRFLDRVFTPAEQAYSRRHRRQAERFSGRFAVKEAVLKMLGTGWQNGIAWTDIEVVNDPAGQPRANLTGRVKALAHQQGIEQIAVSITHTSGLAMASAIALGHK